VILFSGLSTSAGVKRILPSVLLKSVISILIGILISSVINILIDIVRGFLIDTVKDTSNGRLDERLNNQIIGI
jgi:ABC-type bacteriocin/lantibiotic exporter with double-glycine peptidase domain